MELRVYDLQGRVTGLVNGVEKTEIPYSVYRENTVTLFSPSDSYKYEVVGIGEGSYDVMVTKVTKQEATTFASTHTPTSTKAVHQYTIDWNALSQGKKGATRRSSIVSLLRMVAGYQDVHHLVGLHGEAKPHRR